MSEQSSDPSAPLRNGPPEAAGAAARPRLFVLSDIRLLREGIVLALAAQPSVLVVGSADLSMPPAQIAELGPDVLLVDIAAPGGLALARPVRQLLPLVKIVAISVSEVEQDVISCAEAGVSGFISRNGSAQDVVTAAHCAVRGELACSPRTAALIVNRVAALSAKPEQNVEGHVLTRREDEIVSLLSEGLSNKEIARVLRIQSTTVKNHVHSILSKMQVRRRGEVVARLRRGAKHSAASAAGASRAGLAELSSPD